MKQEDLKHETERVVTRFLPLVPKDKAVGKSDFEVVLNEILTCLNENTKIAIDAILPRQVRCAHIVPGWFFWALFGGVLCPGLKYNSAGGAAAPSR
jgi:hypothetical protein